MATVSVFGDRAIRRTVTGLAGLALASTGVLLGAMPAHADAASPIAMCDDTGSGSLANPLDLGGVDAVQSEAYASTDFLTCYDASGVPLITGTGTLTVTAPMACTGEAAGQEGAAREEITWSDGSTTTISGTIRSVQSIDGHGEVAIDGTATGSSFGGLKATGRGSISGQGCGSLQGEATSAHDMIITFS